jgi:hypothetical protein
LWIFIPNRPVLQTQTAVEKFLRVAMTIFSEKLLICIKTSLFSVSKCAIFLGILGRKMQSATAHLRWISDAPGLLCACLSEAATTSAESLRVISKEFRY